MSYMRAEAFEVGERDTIELKGADIGGYIGLGDFVLY